MKNKGKGYRRSSTKSSETASEFGDLIRLLPSNSNTSSTESCEYHQSKDETLKESGPPLSIETPLNDSTLTLWHALLSAIYSDLERSLKRLEFLEQASTTTDGCGPVITSPAQEPGAFHLVSLISELEQISRTLRINLDRCSLLIRALSSPTSTSSKPSRGWSGL